MSNCSKKYIYTIWTIFKLKVSNVKYIHIAVRQISRTFPSSKTQSVLINDKSLSSYPTRPPAPGNHHSTLCFCEFD